jgi:hypothetical protein
MYFQYAVTILCIPNAQYTVVIESNGSRVNVGLYSYFMNEHFILLFKYHHIVYHDTLLFIDLVLLDPTSVEIHRLQERIEVFPYLLLSVEVIIDLGEVLQSLRNQHKVKVLLLLVYRFSVITEFKLV